MFRSVSVFGGRLAWGAAMVGVAAGALVSTSDDAEARSRRQYYKAIRPAPAATFTGASNYAALVVDAKTGRTLYERNPDAIRFPASVTKVMTLYLVFEDLERGRIKLDTPLVMSARCAAAAPSKLYIRPGQTISVEDGIKALVTKSANDVACAFGDNLEGSESAFADRMTRKARAIGMSRSVFRNASGLPNPDHVTTARDLVTLGRGIQDRFPRYYGYFGTRVFAWGRQRIGNHNRLLGRVEGVDGIKTGYTNASGFNLLSSVKSNGRSVVAVVMGGRTGASRDAHMRELIALNLPKAQPGSRTAPLVADAGERAAPAMARPAVMSGLPMPLAAPRVPTSERVASLDADIPMPVAAPRREAPRVVQVSSGATPKPAPRLAAAAVEPDPEDEAFEQEVVRAPAPVARAERPAAPEPKPMRWIVGTAPQVTGSVRDAEPAPAEEAAAQAAPSPKLSREASARATEAAAAPVQAAPRKGWMIQIGATTEASSAEALLSNARSKGGRVLGSAEPYTETYTRGATTYYRARFAGLNEQSADAACKALKRSSVSCFAIKN
ncbi:D-alanyl-D-alanine carboxypeptidase [Methylopila sp. M107]|uniref:D-alanyl-D-alanine carboxypeptidase n=1 Tax=Methylopila sp. M107 TaxID=1101190 RepID=UPI0003A3A9A2|nr:D-alanyl-D-alanine carboxypeptidase [Methylopila sp. M107]